MLQNTITPYITPASPSLAGPFQNHSQARQMLSHKAIATAHLFVSPTVFLSDETVAAEASYV